MERWTGGAHKALRAALYKLGEASDWTDPFLAKILAAAGGDASGLDDALVQGVRRLFPGRLATYGALETAEALRDRHPRQ